MSGPVDEAERLVRWRYRRRLLLIFLAALVLSLLTSWIWAL